MFAAFALGLANDLLTCCGVSPGTVSGQAATVAPPAAPQPAMMQPTMAPYPQQPYPQQPQPGAYPVQPAPVGGAMPGYGYYASPYGNPPPYTDNAMPVQQPPPPMQQPPYNPGYPAK